MKMLLRSLGLALVVVVALAALGANCTDHYTGSELKKAFNELERHLEDTVGLNQRADQYLAAAKKVQKKFGWANYLSRAAKIYVYLNEFQECEHKAIDYMAYIIWGRPNGVPGNEVYQPSRRTLLVPKTFFDRLLEATLTRASNKCKSFIQSLYEKREAEVDAETRRLLHNVMSRQLISEKRVGNIGQNIAKATLSDASLKAELLAMDDDQLAKFYMKYLEDNYAKPCKKFLDKVGTVLESGRPFTGKFSFLVDEPSQEYSDDMVRYWFCKFDTGARYLEAETDNAVQYVKDVKDPEAAQSRRTRGRFGYLMNS